MSDSTTLETVPQEVLEHVTFFSVTHSFLGPPATLLSLLLANRKFYSRLSFTSNPHLYARIFAHKFDIEPVVRRLGPDRTTPHVLAHELKLRCLLLKQFRTRLDSTIHPGPDHETDSETRSRHELLCHAYLMMLDNEGKNEKQLREYAKLDDWLREYWFAEMGASRAVSFFSAELWLPESPERSIAMWLFWFFLTPGDFARNATSAWTALHVLKIFGLAAHKYNVTNAPWAAFDSNPTKSITTVHFGETYQLTPPPLAIPSILSFLTLVNSLGEVVGYTTPVPPSHFPSHSSFEWDCEWARCFRLIKTEYDKVFFTPGSVEGVWEGLFTYTEFTAYTAVLQGASPSVLQGSVVARHRQTWKLREHHLIGTGPRYTDAGVDLTPGLSAGDPLRSFFPPETKLREHRDGLEVYEPGREDVLLYQRAGVDQLQYSEVDQRPSVQDIVITGEGHSSWGQFNLLGRVRPGDGYISLSKEYVDGDRGKWLYQGYLVGSINGNLAGRWRDTITPVDISGYEGTFAMSRRR